MEETKAMLHDQDLPMHLWVEASRTIVYVQNRTPHRVLDNKTLELMRDTGIKTSENIWFLDVHTYPKGEKDQDRSF